MIAELTSLWLHTSKRRHVQFFLILILMVTSSIAEVVSIGAVVPFLAILTSPEQVFQHQYMQFIIDFFQFKDPDELILPVTIAFISAAILSGFMRLLLLYATTRFPYATGADISVEAYRRTLFQDYLAHTAFNTSELINGITIKTGAVTSGILNPALIFISSVVVIIFVVAALFVVDAVVTVSALLVFGLLYGLVIVYTRSKLEENSRKIAKESTQVIKSIQEGIGGIREVLIEQNQDFYCRLYRQSDMPMRRALGNNQFIHGSPRYVIESIGIVLIAGLAYAIHLRDGGVESAIPVLGALALGAQRILPALQQLYGSYASIRSSYASFNDVLHLLSQPLPEYFCGSGSIPFSKGIYLKNVSLYYGRAKRPILNNINMSIPKGSIVGLIGSTGGGKSTLFDIIMGLIIPSSGDIFIDDKLVDSKNRCLWQKRISHVSQNTYLSDASIEENIAFGVPADQIDYEKVRESAKLAQLSEIVESWPEKYKTLVGERGGRLSGGQRQRIGIARAIYKQSDVLILDEATSALDTKTEREVMRSIQTLSKDITILIIAHRTITLRDCDQIYSLENGKLQEKKYSDLDHVSKRKL